MLRAEAAVFGPVAVALRLTSARTVARSWTTPTGGAPPLARRARGRFGHTVHSSADRAAH